MNLAVIHVSCSSNAICEQAWVAERFHQRLRGLLFRPPLQAGDGMLLLGVNSVHTIGMQYQFDVLFLDAEFVVTGTNSKLAPRRILLGPARTRHALELPMGTINRHGCATGDQLFIEPRA